MGNFHFLGGHAVMDVFISEIDKLLTYMLVLLLVVVLVLLQVVLLL